MTASRQSRLAAATISEMVCSIVIEGMTPGSQKWFQPSLRAELDGAIISAVDVAPGPRADTSMQKFQHADAVVVEAVTRTRSARDRSDLRSLARTETLQ
jgi:hypothetical protein